MMSIKGLTRVLCLFATIMFVTPSCKEQRGELKPIRYVGSYNRDFNDMNNLHLEAAQKIGINPISSREEAGKASKKMIEISTNKYYEVEKLTHSIPFLVPEAAKLLEDIGRNFQDTLYNLKTVSDVSQLRKSNINSSENSAHLFGTTFDISWVRFTKIDEKDTLNIDNDRLKMVLATVLRDLKREGRCYIKHERRQGCFHITARK